MSREIAIDEAMIGYKGTNASLRRIYMPYKPTRLGFKIYAVCDSNTAYMGNFQYMKKSKVEEKIPAIMNTLLSPYYGVNHHVFCDKYYSSVEITRTLRSESMYLTGAVKPQRKALPKQLSFSRKINPDGYKKINELNRCPRGTIYYRTQGELTYTLWKDSRIVSLLSSAHSGFRDKVEDHVIRKFSLDGVKASEEFYVPAPTQVIDYIKYMSGVDRHDQMRSYYSTARKANRWEFHLMHFLIDISQVNAYIIYSMVHSDKIPDHGNFVMDLAEQLIAGYSEPKRQQRQNTAHVTLPPASTEHLWTKIGDLTNSRWPKACVGCKKMGLKSKGGTGVRERRTLYGCTACRKHFCNDC
jgi:hypothetical protein